MCESGAFPFTRSKISSLILPNIQSLKFVFKEFLLIKKINPPLKTIIHPFFLLKAMIDTNEKRYFP